MLLVSSVRQHRHHALLIRLRDQHIDIQMTLSLVCLLRQNVTRMRMTTLDLSGRGQPKSLGRTLCVFSFGIIDFPSQSFRISNCRIAQFASNPHFGIVSNSAMITGCAAVALRRFDRSALMSLRPKDDEHLVPFHPRPRFDFANVRQILLQFLQNARAQFAVRHFATAKPDRGFHLVAFLQPLARVLHAIVVVVIVCAGAKLNFLDRDRYLLLLRLVRLLLRFVLKLSEVDDSANRRIGVRRNLDQIQPLLPRGANGIAHIHHAELFTFLTDHAHLRHANSFVNREPAARADYPDADRDLENL